MDTSPEIKFDWTKFIIGVISALLGALTGSATATTLTAFCNL